MSSHDRLETRVEVFSAHGSALLERRGGGLYVVDFAALGKRLRGECSVSDLKNLHRAIELLVPPAELEP